MGRIGKTIEDLQRYRQQWLGGLSSNMPGRLPGGLSGGLPGTLPSGLPGGLRTKLTQGLTGSLTDTLAKGLAGLADGQPMRPPQGAPGRTGLTEIMDFGRNPGQLRMLAFIPEDIVEAPPLVVVLHGCRQTAEGYDLGAGWSQLAEQEGFIVCLPEQRGGNNAHNCFNWFTERNTTRDSGEAGSIAAMVAHLVATHGVDQRRIFITGLSAGGAMTAAMLAAYPDVFAAGAVIAGLPYRVATSVSGALDAMKNGDRRTGPESADAVRGASEHKGPWPRLSVWHGTADQTVTHGNADALIRQWRDLSGLRAQPSHVERIDGQTRRVWLDEVGTEAIEEFEIANFGHGTPLEAAELGQPGPYIMEAGISSTLHIAEFFGVMRKPGGVGRTLRIVRT